MYELIQVAEHTFYMDCPTKVGFYQTGPDQVVLIDSGSDKDAARKVKKILDAQGWKLEAIYNTHSHADHIGGNQYLQKQTGCKIYAPGIDCSVALHPVLEPAMLYGGLPMKELQNKFLMAKESAVEHLSRDVLPEGLELLSLLGHCFDMAGFRTSDNVIFLADCLSSRETLEKYQIGYLYDVRSYLSTLEMVKTLEADCFVPAHAPAAESVAELAQINIDTTLNIIDTIKKLLEKPVAFDDLLAEIFHTYELVMTIQQYALIGSTVKSYLTYLKEEGIAGYSFENNRMVWSLTSTED